MSLLTLTQVKSLEQQPLVVAGRDDEELVLQGRLVVLHRVVDHDCGHLFAHVLKLSARACRCVCFYHWIVFSGAN